MSHEAARCKLRCCTVSPTQGYRVIRSLTDHCRQEVNHYHSLPMNWFHGEKCSRGCPKSLPIMLHWSLRFAAPCCSVSPTQVWMHGAVLSPTHVADVYCSSALLDNNNTRCRGCCFCVRCSCVPYMPWKINAGSMIKT